MLYLPHTHRPTTDQGCQKGNVLVLFVISLLALITLASLALDGGHLLLNKGRLQNLVDAAALHAAKELDQGATKAQASAAAINLLQINLAHTDQQELSRAIAFDGDTSALLTIAYSVEADPFSAVTDPSIDAQFVKVSLKKITLDNFLAHVFSFNKRVSATALAGPSTAIKNCFTKVVPMMVCGTPNTKNFGLDENRLYMMKLGSHTSLPVGPGNFQLLALGGSSSADVILKGLAGAPNQIDTCFNATVNYTTASGNKVNAVATGLNTRLGLWERNIRGEELTYHRDENICQGEIITIADIEVDGVINEDALAAAYEHKAYQAAWYIEDNEISGCTVPTMGLSNPPPNEENFSFADHATHRRRIMPLVVGECNSSGQVNFLGVRCFFLTQKVEHKGLTSYVIGEFIDDCPGGGNPSLAPVDTPGPYKMVLYHVPGSTDS
ncbi:hypothetical protein CMT41_04320 [Colwellia sp. MT41]|uniref:Putative Flp pilus-assembly TadG-like N-terminal domain-containing protein n=1 Tax=Colwellia marinimaniae TaxID=1513592 RepID=A0ABQ0MTB5_9GAMM|nr:MULTISPECIES: Tad domain-containing protein [Colwellia]ALO34036.1 hypothetical protein CMT41_04320 [Colwellia sp. MT41]GAW94871.1 hypothetical protein MTCD1_00469 [Colwellia marinimaniae]